MGSGGKGSGPSASRSPQPEANVPMAAKAAIRRTAPYRCKLRSATTPTRNGHLALGERGIRNTVRRQKHARFAGLSAAGA
jgi:hypothetical protein